MIPIASLWLPILLSGVGVFIASSIIHMALGYHNSDYAKMPEEENVLASMRDAGVQPGSYCFPRAASHKELALPEMQEKFEQGPVGFATVIPSGVPTMGKQLALWFVYSVVVGVCVAYLAGRTIPAGASYLAVFRMAGTTAFLAYGFAQLSDPIWKGQPWSNALKNLFDAFIYGCVTGGVFGSLWP
jgi:hypothetical protein